MAYASFFITMSHSNQSPEVAIEDDGPAALSRVIKQFAVELGFDLVGISRADQPETLSLFTRWFEAGYAGEMHYFERRISAYGHPSNVLPAVNSLIFVGLNYFSRDVDGDIDASTGRIARYAQSGTDYHNELRLRLQRMAAVLHERVPGCRTRAVVDTAPLLERDFARLAGLGWFGKNTMLINKRVGSFFFLGALLTDILIQPDEPHSTSHCGTCTRCLDACPTDAFVEPYVLDARKCIAYLTIELRDHPIPEELRPLMQDWVFGCDVCQDVCPWNRKATPSIDPVFGVSQPRRLRLEDLLTLDTGEFRAEFGNTPIERSKRSGFVRNAAIAAGNSGDQRLVPILRELAVDDNLIVKEAAEWALERLCQAPPNC